MYTDSWARTSGDSNNSLNGYRGVCQNDFEDKHNVTNHKRYVMLAGYMRHRNRRAGLIYTVYTWAGNHFIEI